MSTKTTIRLTVPPTAPLPAPPIYRAIAGGVVVALVLIAFALDALQRRPQPVQEAQPQVVRERVIYVISTPLPTAVPPTTAPTAQPEIVYATVEVPVPVYIEVSSAPQVEAAPATYAPPTEQPAVIGEVVSWEGEVQTINSDWHPPEALPCQPGWRPPMVCQP